MFAGCETRGFVIPEAGQPHLLRVCASECFLQREFAFSVLNLEFSFPRFCLSLFPALFPSLLNAPFDERSPARAVPVHSQVCVQPGLIKTRTAAFSAGPEPLCPSHGALRPEWDNCGRRKGTCARGCHPLSPFRAIPGVTGCPRFVLRLELPRSSRLMLCLHPRGFFWGFLWKSFPGWCLRAGEVNNAGSVGSSAVISPGGVWDGFTPGHSGCSRQ